MKPIHDINYSTSVCPIESWKCRKEGKKLQTFEYLKNEKSFLDEMKNIFHSFQRAIIWWKNKNLIKDSRHKLYYCCELKHKFSKLSTLCNNSLKVSGTRIFFHCNFYYKQFNYKNQSKKHANNKRQLCIIKNQLNIG